MNLIAKKTRGRRTLLQEELMAKTIDVVSSLLLRGAPVSSAVITAVAKGIITANDRSLLVENGGTLSLNMDWARQILYRMETRGEKLVRRMGTTAKIPVAPGILKEVKLDYQRKYQMLQIQHSIPKELIINFDQTPLPYACATKHTLEKQGSKQVPLVGKGKTKQITGTFVISQSSEFLPMQPIYEGKTTKCLPKNVIFPKGFNITFTKNHWSNEEKALELLNKIIFPYIENVKERLDLPSDQKAMLIFDAFRGQTTANVIQHITDKGCVVLYAPNNMTNYFQMLDLNVNGHAKEFLKKKFEVWYAEQATKQIKAGKNIYDVEVPMKMSDMKPIHARWVIGLYDHLTNS